MESFEIYQVNVINSSVVSELDLNHLNHGTVVFVTKQRIEHKVVYYCRFKQIVTAIVGSST